MDDKEILDISLRAEVMDVILWVCVYARARARLLYLLQSSLILPALDTIA
jgi:hypothetical protein